MYCFTNSTADGWIGRGPERGVTLTRPQLLRRGDSDALLAELSELRRQLATNSALDDQDRVLLGARLQKLQSRLGHGP